MTSREHKKVFITAERMQTFRSKELSRVQLDLATSQSLYDKLLEQFERTRICYEQASLDLAFALLRELEAKNELEQSVKECNAVASPANPSDD